MIFWLMPLSSKYDSSNVFLSVCMSLYNTRIAKPVTTKLSLIIYGNSKYIYGMLFFENSQTIYNIS